MLITGCLISCFPLMEQKQPPEYLICAIATTAGNTSCTLTFLSTWKIVLSPPLTSVNIIPSGHENERTACEQCQEPSGKMKQRLWSEIIIKGKKDGQFLKVRKRVRKKNIVWKIVCNCRFWLSTCKILAGCTDSCSVLKKNGLKQNN